MFDKNLIFSDLWPFGAALACIKWAMAFSFKPLLVGNPFRD